LTNGTGYWLKFAQQQTHEFLGMVDYVLNIPVKKGWNLIGSAYKPVPVNSITTSPAGIIQSPFFEYNNGYYQADVLNHGKGYWVRVKQNGTITLPTTYPMNLAKESIYAEKVDEAWPTIVITDAIGRQTKLYLAELNKSNASYELPPVPPADAYDVRFNSDKYVEDRVAGNYIISLNAVTYPIRLRLENFDDEVYQISDGLGGQVFEDLIRNGEEKEINVKSLNALTLQKVVIPAYYELSQNYPNPFNPSTVIKFALPENSKVLLEVYNILGEKVATLINTEMKAGYHSIIFDARNLTSGVYFYRIETSKFKDVKKMVLVK